MGLRKRAIVPRPLGERERILCKARCLRFPSPPMRRETPVGPDSRSLREILGATERGAVVTLGLVPLAAAVMHVRELVLYGGSRRA